MSEITAADLPPAHYTVRVTKNWKELGEVGRQYINTHHKDEKGDDIWDYSPSQIGIKSETSDVFVRVVEHPIDLAALGRLLNKEPKPAAEGGAEAK